MSDTIPVPVELLERCREAMNRPAGMYMRDEIDTLLAAHRQQQEAERVAEAREMLDAILDGEYGFISYSERNKSYLSPNNFKLRAAPVLAALLAARDRAKEKS